MDHVGMYNCYALISTSSNGLDKLDAYYNVWQGSLHPLYLVHNLDGKASPSLNGVGLYQVLSCWPHHIYENPTPRTY